MKCAILYRSILVRLTIGSALVLLAATTGTAEDSAQDEVQAAAKALAAKDNYSWTTTSSITRGDNSFDMESRGMTEKEGLAHVTVPRPDNTFEFVAKEGKGAVKTEQGWRSLSELESGDQNRGGRFLARMIQNFQTPAAEATQMAGQTKEVKKSGDSYTAEFTEEGAKELLTFGRGRDGNAPDVSNAKGTVTFTIKDGVLSKYAFEIEGAVRFEGNEANVRRKTEVEIRDVGTTKLNIPDEAKSKAS